MYSVYMIIPHPQMPEHITALRAAAQGLRGRAWGTFTLQIVAWLMEKTEKLGEGGKRKDTDSLVLLCSFLFDLIHISLQSKRK